MGPTPGEVLAILFTICVPALLIFYFAKRWFALKEKRLDIEALHVAEKTAQHVVRSSELEARLATLERIVTDEPLRLSKEIDALAYDQRPVKDMA